MEKLIRNMVLATLLLLAGMPMRVQAQTSTLTFSRVDSVAKAAETDSTYSSNDGCVYLYNVGASEYVNFGGSWGTQPMTHEVGLPLYIKRGTGDTYSGVTEGDDSGVYYKIGSNVNISYSGPSIKYTGPGYFGYVRTVDNGANKLFVDREGSSRYNHDGIVRMIFSEVSTDTSGPIYNIKFVDYGVSHDASGEWPTSGNNAVTSKEDTTYYLEAQSGDNMVVNAVQGTPDATNTLAQWRLVTRGNFIADFKYTNEADQTETANATFLVVDQNFNRNNANQDTLTVTSSTVHQDDNIWKFSCTTENDTLKVGCANDYVGKGGQATYGAYWLATITGAGELYQSITSCPEAGWYQLKLKGFSTGATPANAFIRTLDSNGGVTNTSTTQLHQFTADIDVNDPESLMKYDTELIAASSTYQTETTAMIYVGEGNTFQIGVTANSASEYTLIDDVQLYYAGKSYPPYVLDERWLKVDSINAQLSDGDTRTLLLKRTLVEEQWNSLVLPVSLTVKQVKDAFGGDTQVCELEKTERNGYDIYFRSIEFEQDTQTESGNTNAIVTPLANTDTLIVAGSMYIVWPSDLTLTNSDATYVYKDSTDTEQTLKLDAPYFSIPLVAIKEKVADDGIVTDTVVVESDIDKGICMQGTYVRGTEIPRFSYAISTSNGKWYYLTSQNSSNTTGSGVTSKGYRAWILTEQGTGSSSSGAHPAVANLFVDNVQITDGIERVVQDLLQQEPTGTVYTLSGQMVNEEGSLEGLPKGVYVKGGKKYVVK